MSESAPRSGDRIRFTNQRELETAGEAILKHRYGRGIYIQEVEESNEGHLRVRLGNTVPKDLSDSLERDGVLKFNSVRHIHTLRAEPTNGHYIIELPDRGDIYDGYKNREQDIIEQLDYSMAKSIYEDVLHFGEVENQLTPIRQIFRWVWERGPLSIEAIKRNQRSKNTDLYLNVLSELEYIWVEGGEVHAGERMNSAEFQGLDSQQFIESIMGDLVQRGYHTLRDRCDLRMLSHYPQFSGAYYYDAIQRQDPEFHLNIETITENLWEQYGKRYGELYVDDKLAQLSNVGVLEKEGDYVSADTDVFEQVSRDVPLA